MASAPGEADKAFENRLCALFIAGWDRELDGQPIPIGGEDTLTALGHADPLVNYEIRTKVVDHWRGIYKRYEEAAKALGLLRPQEAEAPAAKAGRAPSSSSRGRGSAAPSPSASGA